MGSKHRLSRMKRTYETRIERASAATKTLDEWALYNNVHNGIEEDVLAQFGQMAIHGWRFHHRTIYEVDPDLLQELIDSEVPEQEIPVDVLRRIPHNCPLFVLPEPLIIEHPEFTCLYDQFLLIPLRVEIEKGRFGRPEEVFKHNVYIDGPDVADEIKFLWFGKNIDDDSDQMITTQTIFLKGQKKLDLRDQLQSIISDLDEQSANARSVKRDANWKDIVHKQFAVAVALTLYVCSDEPDMIDIEPPEELVSKKVLSPGLPSVKTLGIRIGSALRSHRQAVSSDTGDGITKSVMPHLRKAHWHRFWTGPRNGERKLIIRWLPPVPVNAHRGKITTTIRPLKGD